MIAKATRTVDVANQHGAAAPVSTRDGPEPSSAPVFETSDLSTPGHAETSSCVFPGLIGTSAVLRRALTNVPHAIRTNETVLISGETGTGKELVARAIHYLGSRVSYPFVPVNCGTLVDTLLGSELFGHERGAFTDAHVRAPGLIAHADGGTVFLDEVDALTLRGQVALLRVLQDKTVRAIGSTQDNRVDVRFIAATNTPLRRLVDAGVFRADLYFRLSVFAIDLPPLRERVGDLVLLAAYLLKKHTAPGTAVPQLSPAAVAALFGYDWPGNVRELENAVIRAMHNSRDGLIRAEDLGLPTSAALTDAVEPRSFSESKRRIIQEFERRYLTELMIHHHGNVTSASRAAGKERRELGKLLKKHGLDPRTLSVLEAPRSTSRDRRVDQRRAGGAPPGFSGP
jgi:DNA-binding NtrC family response regulator